jgi:hypothetical protein
MVCAGVRQGGVMSPILFATYIDNMIKRLSAADVGCSIGDIYLGCIVYADDILLLSASVVHLQRMLDICSLEARELDMKFNVSKSFAMRIGPRFKHDCASLTVGGLRIEFVNDIKYLGIVIRSGRKFACLFDHVKLKFYRAFNLLYARSKAANSELISVQLTKSFCLPLIMYGLEVSNPTHSSLRMLDGLVDCATRRIFNITDNDNVADTRCAIGLHSVESLYVKALCRCLIALSANNKLSFAGLIFNLVFDGLKPQLNACLIRDDCSKLSQLHSLIRHVTSALHS